MWLGSVWSQIYFWLELLGSHSLFHIPTGFTFRLAYFNKPFDGTNACSLLACVSISKFATFSKIGDLNFTLKFENFYIKIRRLTADSTLWRYRLWFCPWTYFLSLPLRVILKMVSIHHDDALQSQRSSAVGQWLYRAYPWVWSRQAC